MKTATFKIMTLLLIMSLSLSAEVLKQQSFEGATTDTWGYTPDPVIKSGGAGWSYHVWGPEAVGQSVSTSPDGSNSVWIARNTREATGSNDPAILTFNQIDISDYNTLTLSFSYNTSSGHEENDIIQYHLEYTNNPQWDNPTQLTYGTSGWVEKSIEIPSEVSYINLRFEIDNNNQAEIVAFDCIKLETKESASPITLADFSAKALSSGIELSWTTGSESENSGFKLYRDNEVIAFIEGAGTTTETNDYSYLDKNVIPGKTYTYTLADLSYDNTEEIHENKTITVTAAKNLVDNASFTLDAAYPNPFNPSTSIDYSLTETQNIELSIFNMKGERVITLFDGERTAGQYSQIWYASHVQSGVYLLRARYGNQITTQKLLLLK